MSGASKEEAVGPQLPFIVEPEQLHSLLDAPWLRVVDLSKASVHGDFHIPGALFLEYGELVRSRQPTHGLLPPLAQLAQSLAKLALEGHWVVAYDDEGGGKAGRLIWTLHLLGFRRVSLLNGGLHAWANERYRLEQVIHQPPPVPFQGVLEERLIADADFIHAHLGEPGYCWVDARSLAEYRGEQRFAARAGHIPGAIHWDWLEVMDQQRSLRLRPEAELRQALQERGIDPQAEVVTYCQTHHRSSLLYVVLHALGLERVRGYPGSWSDWGNRLDLPVEGG